MLSTGIELSSVVHPSFRDDANDLSGYVLAALGAIAGFLVMNVVLTTVYIVAFNGGVAELPPGVRFLASGLALLVPVGLLWWWLDARERAAAFPFRVPDTTELAWTLAFVPLGVAASAVGIDVGTALGFEYLTFGYDLTNPVTAVGVLVGPVLLAPLLEELLFRGLLIGSLTDRRWSPPVAGLAALVAFAAPHVWLGVAGMLGIAAWTVFPTILRLKFDNLAGAYGLHLLNNVYSYVVVVAVAS